MQCLFNFCIYNKDQKCTLNEISIDTMGMCGECIPVNFDSSFLEAEKKRQVKYLEKLREKVML